MAQFIPYIKPMWGEILRLDEQTEFTWNPVDPNYDVTGVNYVGYEVNPTTRVLSPISIWSPPADTGWHIVAAFALFETPTSPTIKNYLCFEARIYDDTSSGYTVSVRWTIRQNLTGYPLLYDYGGGTAVYSIPGTPSKENPQVIFNQGTRGDHYFIAMGIYCRGTYAYGGETLKYYYPESICIRADLISTTYGYFDSDRSGEKIDDPNKDDEDEGPGKGGGSGGTGGTHRLPDEGVPVPGLPEYGAAGVSWLTVYKMTQAEINDFGSVLIDPTFWQAVKSYFVNPLEAIVGISLIPCDVATTRTKHPSVGSGPGGMTWPNAYPVCTTEFIEFDCGKLHIEPYWDSAFDFDPYTKFSLFLPFIGFRAIKADDIMGADIGVKYHINLMTGDVVAFVTRFAQSESVYGPIMDQVIGEYNGNCTVRVAIGRTSLDAAIDSSLRLLSTGLGMVGGALSAAAGLADPGNIGESQMSNQISNATMTTLNGMKQGVERSGSLGGSCGYMGNLKPYIIRTIPRQFLPDNYKKLNGYPANKGGTLAQFAGTGYQAVENIRLDNISAFESEIDEIKAILKGGVIV